MKYITVNQYKRIGDGIPMSDLTDTVLAFMINRAEAAVDSYMGFDLKRGGFEPHQTLKQALFDYHTLRTGFSNFPVPIRTVDRYRIQVSNISTSGAGFFANINTGDAVINLDGGYVEIVPLQAVTYSLSPVILQLGLRPPIIEIDTSLGFYIATLGEALLNDNGDNQVFHAMRQYWAATYTQSTPTQPVTLPPVPPVIYANNVVQNPSTYTINYTEGIVTFNTPFTAPAPTITADYTYQIPDQVMMATVEQVSHLLSIRALNKLGMYHDVGSVKSGDATLTRELMPRGQAAMFELSHVLCPEARGYLTAYMEIPVE